MSDDPTDFDNELMKDEDELIEEMKAEFQKRFQERLQAKIQARESAMPEVQRLKKNGTSCESCEPPSES